jgi:hypothetical protein
MHKPMRSFNKQSVACVSCPRTTACHCLRASKVVFAVLWGACTMPMRASIQHVLCGEQLGTCTTTMHASLRHVCCTVPAHAGIHQACVLCVVGYIAYVCTARVLAAAHACRTCAPACMQDRVQWSDSVCNPLVPTAVNFAVSCLCLRGPWPFVLHVHSRVVRRTQTDLLLRRTQTDLLLHCTTSTSASVESAHHLRWHAKSMLATNMQAAEVLYAILRVSVY